MDSFCLRGQAHNGQRKYSKQINDDYSEIVYRSNKYSSERDATSNLNQSSRFHWNKKLSTHCFLPTCLKDSIMHYSTPQHNVEVDKSINEFKKLVSDSIKAIHTSCKNKNDIPPTKEFSSPLNKKSAHSNRRKILNRTSVKGIWASANKHIRTNLQKIDMK